MGQEGDIEALASAVLPVLFAPPEYAFSFAFATLRERSAPPRRKRRGSLPASIHRLRVTLLGVRPPIWRRLEVPSDITLGELHDIVQAAMGWDDSHLHDFRVGDFTYGDPDLLEELSDGDERTARLDDVAPGPKGRLRYTYDFGDSWEHEILVEAITAPEPGQRYPVCVTGRRACPPEDCGGIWGYADLLEAIADPANPDHEELLDWLGDPFDPEAFDVAEVNARLARLR